MWCEARILLSEVMKRAAAEREEERPFPPLLRSAWDDAVKDPHLHRPRLPIQAALGTSAAFAIGKASLACGGPGPGFIAAELVGALEKLGGGLMTFSVARGGYINFDFSAVAVDSLIAGLAASPPDEVYQFPSLLPWELKGRELLYERLEPVWPEIYERAAGLKDESLTLLQALPESAGTRLVFLGLLGDPEFDARPFLRSLCGKENLPWLFRKFAEDLSGAIAAFPVEKAELAAPPLLSHFVRDIVCRLIWVRHSYASAARHNRPEEFLSCLIDLVKCFYSYFTRPELRELLLRPQPGKSAESVRQTLGALDRVVSQGLRALIETDVQRREMRSQYWLSQSTSENS